MRQRKIKPVIVITAITVFIIVALSFLLHERKDKKNFEIYHSDIKSFTPQSADEKNIYPPISQKKSPHIKTPTQAKHIDGMIHNNPYERVYNSSDIPVVISDLLSEPDILDYNVRTVLNETIQLCGQDIDPYKVTSLPHKDDSRSWAFKKVLDLCDGLNIEMIRQELERTKEIATYAPDPVGAARQNSISVGIDLAQNIIQSENDWFTLYSAGQLLLENQAIPLKEIFANPSEIGYPELLKSWSNASRLVQCASASGCNANSIPTLMICMAGGCREGSTYQDALQQNLSPREYEATMAFYNWIMQQRADNR